MGQRKTNKRTKKILLDEWKKHTKMYEIYLKQYLGGRVIAVNCPY